MKQESFWKAPSKKHGGSEARGKRKSARAIVTDSPMHLTFKASRARGDWNMLRFEGQIDSAIRETAERYRIRLYGCQNVGNHLHLLAQAASRQEMQNFLRVLPQAIAFIVTGTRRGNGIGRFWDDSVYSRVVHWGRDFIGMKNYLLKNRLEAHGVPRDVVDMVFMKPPLSIQDDTASTS